MPLTSSTDWSYRHHFGIGQLVLTPLLGLLVAAGATGFPWVDPQYAYEMRVVQFAALTSAFCSGSVIAIAFWPSMKLSRTQFLVNLAALMVALACGHLLWVQPIWGFHHDHTLGIFAWLFLGFEDGLFIMPNLLGVLLTHVSYLGCIAGLHAIAQRRLDGESPAT